MTAVGQTSRATSVLVAADRVLLPSGISAPGWVRITGETITGAGAGTPAMPADRHLAGTVVPGFIDLHCHGGAGGSVADPDAVQRVIDLHRAHGTTSLMASLVTEPLDVLVEQVAALAPLVAQGALVGVHLEGPWLSARKCGAHDPALVHPPSTQEIDRLLTAGAGAVRMVTLAPELPGGLVAVRQLVERDVVAAVGHTDADYARTRQALDAGARVATHLFNGMRTLHHREPGPVLALLQDRRVTVELVADGVHLRPEVLAWAAQYTAGGFVLVTDAMAAAGAGDGDYRLATLDVQVRDGVARLSGTDQIAGSTLTMDAALRFAVNQAGVPFAAAVRAITSTPAKVLGRKDIGLIEPGRRADLVVLDDALQVVGVSLGGVWQSDPQASDVSGTPALQS